MRCRFHCRIVMVSGTDSESANEFDLQDWRERVWTDLMSNSARVIASRTTSLMHGGGVMGRLSCRLPTYLSPFICIESFPIAYLVSESAHASTYGLLDNIQAVRLLSSCGLTIQSPERTCISFHPLSCLSVPVLAVTVAGWAAPLWQTRPRKVGMEEPCDRWLEESPW